MEQIIEVAPECQSTYLSDYSDKDKKWDKHRGDAQSIELLYQSNPKYSRLAERMGDCSERLLYQWTHPDEHGETKFKLKKATFCKVRHCPVCGWRRSMRNVARFFSKMPDLREQYPTHRWLFLTLTVRNCPLDELRSTIQHMNKSWQRLIQRKDWPAVGWIRTVEVTRAKDGKAHPHFHCLLLVKPSYFGKGYIKQEEWVERWAQSARLDYLPQVDIRVVKPKIEGQDLQAAVVETLKYGTKVSDGLESAEWLYGITDQLHKSRFLASGGALAGILKEEMTDAELVAGDEAEAEIDDQAQISFAWRRDERRYKKT